MVAFEYLFYFIGRVFSLKIADSGDESVEGTLHYYRKGQANSGGKYMKNNLTQGNIMKTLVWFTVPLILSGLLQQMFN